MLRAIASGLILTGAILAQPSAPRLEFEVASVRAGAPRTQGEIMGMRGGPGSTDPERINFRGATLRNLLLRAYGLDPDRLSAPSWLTTVDFDITAKLPSGTTNEQFLVMLQNLLVDRFKITLHHEMKTFAVYELTVAKGGLKMKPSSAEPLPPPGAGGPTPADPAALQAQVQQQLQQVTAQLRNGGSNTLDADGFPPLPEGNRPFLRGMTVNGRMLVSARGQNMAGVVRALQNGLGGGARVVGKTGLTGLYDFKLQYAPRGNAAAPDKHSQERRPQVHSMPPTLRPTFPKPRNRSWGCIWRKVQRLSTFSSSIASKKRPPITEPHFCGTIRCVSVSTIETQMSATDEQLLKRLVKGDEEAFATLYRVHHGAICRFALHMTGQMELAQDITQESFLALALHGRRYDASRGSVMAFLYGIARNLVLKRLEKERPENSTIELEEIAGDDDVLGDLTRRESIDEVRRAVLSLPQAYREAVVLCELGDASYEDAALALGCPVGTVRSRLNRARAMLAKKLTPRSLVL